MKAHNWLNEARDNYEAMITEPEPEQRGFLYSEAQWLIKVAQVQALIELVDVVRDLEEQASIMASPKETKTLRDVYQKRVDDEYDFVADDHAHDAMREVDLTSFAYRD